MGVLLSTTGGMEQARLDRLFFAIFPDADAAAQIAALAQRIHDARGLAGKPFAPDRFHVSLSHLGDYDEIPTRVLADAFVAGASTAIAPFEVTFNRIGSFQRGNRTRPLVLRSSDDAALHALHRGLGAEMRKSGLGGWIRPAFTPHVTLLYDHQQLDEVPIRPIRWTVRELVLVESLLGQTKHQYLARWTLRG